MNLSLLAALGVIASAQPSPTGGMHLPVGAPSAAIPVKAEAGPRRFSVTTKVVEVGPDGGSRPLPGVLAWVLGTVNQPGPRGGSEEIVARASARADASGTLKFADVTLVDEARYHVEIAYQGVAYSSAVFSPNSPAPASVRVFRASDDARNVHFRLLFDVQVGDGSLQVTELVRVDNDGLTTVDTTQLPYGLRLPAFAYQTLGLVPTWGMFPQGQPVGGAAASTGLGKVVGERGGLVYRGPILPGTDLSFQFTYSIPFTRERLTLAALSDVTVNEAILTIRFPDHVAVGSLVEGVARSVESREGNQVRRDNVIGGPLLPGSPVRVTLDRLPAASMVPAYTVLWLVGLLGLVASALVFGAARRRMAAQALSPSVP